MNLNTNSKILDYKIKNLLNIKLKQYKIFGDIYCDNNMTLDSIKNQINEIELAYIKERLQGVSNYQAKMDVDSIKFEIYMRDIIKIASSLPEFDVENKWYPENVTFEQIKNDNNIRSLTLDYTLKTIEELNNYFNLNKKNEKHV